MRTVNGELAQSICLAAHGTRWLRDPTGPPPRLEETSSTFKFVAAVRFESEGGPGSGGRGSVGSWLESLRRSGVDRLWLAIPETRTVSAGGHPVDEHSLAGSANAGRWSILATGTTTTGPASSPRATGEFWHGAWKLGDRNAPDRRIWLVNYLAVPATDAVATVPELGHVEEELTGALSEAHDLAVDQALDSWAAWFEKALAPNPEMPFHPDMLPGDWPHAARRCAARAAQAWVFGGMGSWNDLDLPDPETRQRHADVSRRLYGAILDALVAATNCAL